MSVPLYCISRIRYSDGTLSPNLVIDVLSLDLTSNENMSSGAFCQNTDISIRVWKPLQVTLNVNDKWVN